MNHVFSGVGVGWGEGGGLDLYCLFMTRGTLFVFLFVMDVIVPHRWSLTWFRFQYLKIFKNHKQLRNHQKITSEETQNNMSKSQHRKGAEGHWKQKNDTRQHII